MKADDVHLTEEVSETNNNGLNRTTANVTNKTDDKITNNPNPKIDVNRSEESSIGSTTSLNNTINSEPNPSGHDDTKSNSTTSSAQYSLTDNSDTGDPKRTLINKYVKKVKNLMKK